MCIGVHLQKKIFYISFGFIFAFSGEKFKNRPPYKFREGLGRNSHGKFSMMRGKVGYSTKGRVQLSE